MFQRLIKKTSVEVEERTLSVHYYETRHAARRFAFQR